MCIGLYFSNIMLKILSRKSHSNMVEGLYIPYTCTYYQAFLVRLGSFIDAQIGELGFILCTRKILF